MANPKVSEDTHSHDDMFQMAEVQLAFRNRGIPAEALRLPITPTGLHYLLNHFDIPMVDAPSWQLTVDGQLRTPLKLDLDDIAKRPAVTLPVTMECAGNGRSFAKPRRINQPWMHEAVSTAEWTGTPLKQILLEAELADEAVEVIFTGRDRGIQGDEDQYYQRSLRIEDAMLDEVILAYEMNGAPLEPQHGYPLRLLVPGWYGMTSVKWLDRIEAVDKPFRGYQMLFYIDSQGEDDQGTAIERMRVRALMAPPGIQIFPTMGRLVEAGPVTLVGRAWAGHNSIARVEVSTDDGGSWHEAELDDPIGDFAWRGWRYEWDASPGTRVLSCRATDSAGNVQPTEPVWNFYGVANNGAARIAVTVE